MSKKRAASREGSSSSSSSAGGEGDNTMRLELEEDGDLEGAASLRVVVNEVVDGKKRKRRVRYRCTVTLHNKDNKKIDGFKYYRRTLETDPRGFEGEKLKLRQFPWRISNSRSGSERRTRRTTVSTRATKPMMVRNSPALIIMNISSQAHAMPISRPIRPPEIQARGGDDQRDEHRFRCPVPVLANRICALPLLGSAAGGEGRHRAHRPRASGHPQSGP